MKFYHLLRQECQSISLRHQQKTSMSKSFKQIKLLKKLKIKKNRRRRQLIKGLKRTKRKCMKIPEKIFSLKEIITDIRKKISSKNMLLLESLNGLNNELIELRKFAVSLSMSTCEKKLTQVYHL